MMAFLMDLPIEILIIIIKKLDTKSTYNLYQTCQTMKDITHMRGVVRECNLSLSTLASAKSLKLDMIKNISTHLYELNMSGVCDASKKLLLPAIQRMKCLKTLNVTYTNITIIDLLDIQKCCPTIKNIAIDFKFFKCEEIYMSHMLMYQCQELFTYYDNVHFVMEKLASNFPLQVLKDSSLDTLTYTVYNWKGDVYMSEINEPMIPFNHFCIFLLNWGPRHLSRAAWRDLLHLIQLENIEFVIIESCVDHTVYTSPMFANFFLQYFNVKPSHNLSLQKSIEGNLAIFIWNKETTVFDSLFYSNLRKRIKSILTCQFKTFGEQQVPLDVNLQLYEWYHIKLDERVERGNIISEPIMKKKRTAPPSRILDFDGIFSEHKSVKLAVSFLHQGIITLAPHSMYLRKLTFLSINNLVARYSNEFFNVLFRSCENLETLNVNASPVSPCSAAIMRSIPLSKSLKNIRLHDYRIDFNMLFSSFSQCRTLENVCIIDSCPESNELADPTLLYVRCNNLYSLKLHAVTRLDIERKMYRKVHALVTSHYSSNHHMHFTLLNGRDGIFANPYEYLPYDIYMQVFNLKPIKPV